MAEAMLLLPRVCEDNADDLPCADVQPSMKSCAVIGEGTSEPKFDIRAEVNPMASPGLSGDEISDRLEWRLGEGEMMAEGREGF